MLLKLLMTRAGIAGMGLAATLLAWQLGSVVGHRHGKEEARLLQIEANVKADSRIKERVKNALDEIHADTSDDAIDRVLRELAGE